MRWCWHPEAAAHVERGTGRDFAWPALHNVGAPAVAGANWPKRTEKELMTYIREQLALSQTYR